MGPLFRPENLRNKEYIRLTSHYAVAMTVSTQLWKCQLKALGGAATASASIASRRRRRPARPHCPRCLADWQILLLRNTRVAGAIDPIFLEFSLLAMEHLGHNTDWAAALIAYSLAWRIKLVGQSLIAGCHKCKFAQNPKLSYNLEVELHLMLMLSIYGWGCRTHNLLRPIVAVVRKLPN